jgi:hypothetical protein
MLEMLHCAQGLYFKNESSRYNKWAACDFVMTCKLIVVTQENFFIENPSSLHIYFVNFYAKVEASARN